MPPKLAIIPVANTDVLSTPKGVLIVLWTIREYGPLNFAKLFELLFAGEPNRLANNLTTDSRSINLGLMNRMIIEALHRLSVAEMIVTEGGSLDALTDSHAEFKAAAESRKNLKFSVSPELKHLQEIFGFSLSHLASASSAEISVTPAFTSAQNRKAEDWTDVFVIMPFSEEIKPIYDKHVLPVVRNLGLSCKRGDDFYSNDTIIDDVWNAIFFAKLIICDVTGRNPNVFYELGIAHTIGRPTILISQDTREIPFDIRHRRILPYDNSPLEMRHFRDALKKAVEVELGLEPSNELSNILDKLDGLNDPSEVETRPSMKRPPSAPGTPDRSQ